MEGSCNNVVLLLFCKLDEVYGITGNADCKLRILLGVLLSVKKSVAVKYVNV